MTEEKVPWWEGEVSGLTEFVHVRGTLLFCNGPPTVETPPELTIATLTPKGSESKSPVLFIGLVNRFRFGAQGASRIQRHSKKPLVWNNAMPGGAGLKKEAPAGPNKKGKRGTVLVQVSQ